MAQYRYVGSHAEIYDTPYTFRRFGQLVELPDDVAKVAIEGGVHVLPAVEFDQLGFTAEELKKFGDVSKHGSAPEEFLAKRNAAWAMFDEDQKKARLAAFEVKANG